VYIHCSSASETYWTSALYSYKGLIIVFGVFMSWQSKTTDVSEHADSSCNAVSIYNMAVICVLGVPVTYLLPHELITVKFVYETSLVIFCSIVCTCLLHIPKVKARAQCKTILAVNL